MGNTQLKGDALYHLQCWLLQISIFWLTVLITILTCLHATVLDFLLYFSLVLFFAIQFFVMYVYTFFLHFCKKWFAMFLRYFNQHTSCTSHIYSMCIFFYKLFDIQTTKNIFFSFLSLICQLL